MTTLAKSTVRAASLAASTDETRENLGALHWDPRGFLEATNGHVLLRVPCDPPPSGADRFVQAETAKPLTREKPHNGAIRWCNLQADAESLRTSGLAVPLTDEPASGVQYPKTDSSVGEVKPLADTDCAGRFAVSAEYLGLIAKAAKEVAATYVVVEPDADEPSLRAIRFRLMGESLKEERAHGLLMPCRL